ncbi:MAG: hypothetical protein C0490_19355 [Marivirga sp.]|nr:hypothetical protein [Marivirga sp.]
MSNTLKKLLAAIISALIGLALIPILTLEFSFEWLPMLIIYFLPGFCVGLVIVFEILTRIRVLREVYSFVQGVKMIFLFFALLIVEWTIMWKVDPSNDAVFASQFATATIPSIWMYSYLGKRMTFLNMDMK